MTTFLSPDVSQTDRYGNTCSIWDQNKDYQYTFPQVLGGTNDTEIHSVHYDNNGKWF